MRKLFWLIIIVFFSFLFISELKVSNESQVASESQVSSSPTPYYETTPTPTPSPVVAKPNPTQEPTPKYDGTRTGRIIKYNEWCSGKEISIYENELLTKKASDGKTYTMTQGDWDCYERSLTSKPKTQQGYTTPYSGLSGSSYYSGDLETAWIIKDIDNGDNVIIERRFGEKWLLEAKTWCSWCWRYEGRKVYLIFGYVTSKLINDDGDVAEFWTEEEL